jgi:PAS domain S-box-containing protein
MLSAVTASDRDIINRLVEDLPVGLWVARAPAGELVYANRRFQDIMGMAARADVKVGEWSEPYGIYTRDGRRYPEDRLPFVRALRQRAEVVVDDITIHRSDGTRVDVRASARPVFAAGGDITHVVIAFYDISREVEAERRRAESDRRLHLAQRLEAIGNLAGGIAHDFNNLVAGAKLLAQQLAAREADASRREMLGMIDEITDRAAALTRSLLAFAWRGPLRTEPVALNALVESMVVMLRRTLSGIDISIDTTAADGGSVIGEPTQLEQVIMNLVVNSRDALRGRDGGKVAIRTRDVVLDAPPPRAIGTVAAGRHVVLEVQDNGPGIPAELRDRVFEPYFTTKDHGPERGTGLGLATVYGIVERHGGAVELAPGLDGGGVTFRIYVPASPTAAVIVPGPPTTEVPHGTGEVLVVDDDTVVRHAMSRALASLGYDPIEASSGAEAIAIYRVRGADIRAVVLDMIMPGMGGGATYRALRELDPGVSVLLVSGYAVDEDVESVLALGVRGFLSKPCSVPELGRAVAAILA